MLRLLRGQKRGESPQLTLANSAPKQELGDPEIELSADPKLAFTEAAEPVSEPVTANREPNGGFARGKGGKGGARVAWRSSVQVVKQERKQEAVAAAVEPSATTKSQRVGPPILISAKPATDAQAMMLSQPLWLLSSFTGILSVMGLLPQLHPHALTQNPSRR